MGWPQRTVLESRFEFVTKARSGDFTMTQLCASFGVSRKTGYKWLRRYGEGGLVALEDQCRAPKQPARVTAEPVIEMILQLRDKRPTWGAAKLKARLERLHPELSFPARSTIHDILKRNGRVEERSRRRRRVAQQPPLIETCASNDVWCTDFKGEFLMGNGRYCYPLTVLDWGTRYALGCDGKHSVESCGARQTFERLFDEYGVPQAILNDNGVPFSSPKAICGLSQLNVWWLKLGIELFRSQPAHPEQNPRIERFHRTLKAETTRPPQADLAGQQARFDRFLADYNEVRPHEALDFEVPADRYERSTRRAVELDVSYPGHFEVRRVSTSGKIKLQSRAIFVSNTLAGEYIGFEEVDDQRWAVHFLDNLLGHLDERTGRLEAVGPTPVRMCV